MLNQPTLEKLQIMKLCGMADAFRPRWNPADTSQLSFEKRFAMLVDQQWLWKETWLWPGVYVLPISRNVVSS